LSRSRRRFLQEGGYRGRPATQERQEKIDAAYQENTESNSTSLANLVYPAELKKELLEEFGNPCIDDKGHLHDYTEQDICERLRKILRPYESQYHDKGPEWG